MSQAQTRTIVLASRSPYRRQLLQTLGLDFQCRAADIDETPRPGEGPETLASRLAADKAQALAPLFPDALIIGSDQVACLDGDLLGKPGEHPRALAQLQACRGRSVDFYTSLSVLDSLSGAHYRTVETYTATFKKHLSDRQLDNYLRRDRPYDCAGSFKCESLGIALFESLRGDDPNTLVGLPLIALTDLLAKAGVDVLG